MKPQMYLAIFYKVLDRQLLGKKCYRKRISEHFVALSELDAMEQCMARHKLVAMPTYMEAMRKYPKLNDEQLNAMLDPQQWDSIESVTLDTKATVIGNAFPQLAAMSVVGSARPAQPWRRPTQSALKEKSKSWKKQFSNNGKTLRIN